MDGDILKPEMMAKGKFWLPMGRFLGGGGQLMARAHVRNDQGGRQAGKGLWR